MTATDLQFFGNELISDMYEEQYNELFEAESKEYDSWFSAHIKSIFSSFDDFAADFQENSYAI